MDTDLDHSGLFLSVFDFGLLGMISSPGLVSVMVLFVLCSGLISGSEVAFFSLDRQKQAFLRDENSRSALRILKLLSEPRRLLATILIANNFINISIVIISDLLIRQMIVWDRLLDFSENLISTVSLSNWLTAEAVAKGINFFMAVVISSFILLLFGEVLPKIYARLNGVSLAKKMALPLSFLNRVFYPVSSVLIYFSSIFERRVDGKQIFQNLELKKDLDKAIEITASDSQESIDEVNFLKRILNFSDVPVKQIMKSRVDVVALDENLSFNDVIAIIKASGYSRLPVYSEDFDHLVGLLYTKDLIPYIDKEIGHWHDLIRRDLFYVPDSKKINDLLRAFQAKRMHIAIVVDEYGGNTGIVTLEDVMEEVIGEIKDEFDDEDEQEFYKIDEENYLFEGKTLINDFCKIVEIDSNMFDELRGESDSLAGLILEILGKFPNRNEEVNVGKLRFTVLSVNSRRIKQIKLTLLKSEESLADEL